MMRSKGFGLKKKVRHHPLDVHADPVMDDARVQTIDERSLSLLSISQPLTRESTSIERACPRTCGLAVSETAEFKEWRDRTDLTEPATECFGSRQAGAGKSTLMKHTSAPLPEAPDDSSDRGHFFNARGHALEKTPQACRSRLYISFSKTTLYKGGSSFLSSASSQ